MINKVVVEVKEWKIIDNCVVAFGTCGTNFYYGPYESEQQAYHELFKRNWQSYLAFEI